MPAMSMLPPAVPDNNTNNAPSAPDPGAGPSRRVPVGTAPSRPLGFTGPKPRLAGDGTPTPPPHQTAPGSTDPHPSRRSVADGKPRLRLVGAKALVKPDLAPAQGIPIAGTADPRWVLAVRVAEQLQGSALPPSKRERLIKIGKMFGLTAFDANLIIAIVQDQARRGYAPAYCPTAGEAQLRMVPPPVPKRWMTGQRTLLIAGIIAGFIALELIVLSWVF